MSLTNFINLDNLKNKGEEPKKIELQPFIRPDQKNKQIYNNSSSDLTKKRDLTVPLKVSGKIKNIINVLFEQATSS